MSVLRKGGVIRDAIAPIETAEPAIPEAQVNLFTQPSLRTEATAIPDQKHPDQQFGTDVQSARVAVELRQMDADAAQINKPINRRKKMILGDMILQRELVKQCRLCFLLAGPENEYILEAYLGFAKSAQSSGSENIAPR